MEKKKKIIIIILISLVILSIVISSNSRLVDRALYRIGIQEQVCFSDTSEDYKSQNGINFVFVGDFGINKNSLNTLNNIKSVNPEIILLVGDLGQTTFKEWKELSTNLKNETVYTVLGDADDEVFFGENYLKHYGLKNEYYSFDYENIHFLGISTKIGNISDDYEQLEFIRNDLEKNYQNSDTEWTIVFMHLPMYSSRTVDQVFVNEIRNELQPIFDRYDVNLVINGHKHAYERSVPLMYNNVETNVASCMYEKYKGQIYITVGTGGHSHSPFTEKESWSVIQNDNDYGFFNIKLLNDGKILYGEFVSNNGKVMDSIKIYLNDKI
jgi:predicted phosphodiesterase